MSNTLKIKVSLGWADFVMEADLATIKALQAARRCGSMYMEGSSIDYINSESPEITLIDEFPSHTFEETEAMRNALAEKAIKEAKDKEDLDNKDDEIALAEYNEVE